MKQFIHRLLRLIFGLFLYALGVVFTIQAAIGYAPWEVFHVGLAIKLGISIGTASIVVGLVIIAIVMLNKERVGLGTVLNIFLIGFFIDLIMILKVIPGGGMSSPGGIATGVLMLVAGLCIIAFGSYFYIDSGFGAGPRDSLMVLLSRKTRLPVGLCRNIIEFSAAASGWLLGGMIGIGTVVSVIMIGICVQLVFRLFRFDPKAVRHQNLRDTWSELNTLKSSKTR